MLHSILSAIWVIQENPLVSASCRGLDIRCNHLVVVAKNVYGVNADVVNFPIDVKIYGCNWWMLVILHLRTIVPCSLLIGTFLVTGSTHYGPSSLLEVTEV